MGEEGAHLLSRPCLHGWPGIGAGPWRIGGVGRVAGKATPSDRITESAMQDGVDVLNGTR